MCLLSPSSNPVSYTPVMLVCNRHVVLQYHTKINYFKIIANLTYEQQVYALEQVHHSNTEVFVAYSPPKPI